MRDLGWDVQPDHYLFTPRGPIATFFHVEAGSIDRMMALVRVLNLELERALLNLNTQPPMGMTGPQREWKETVLSRLLMEVLPSVARLAGPYWAGGCGQFGEEWWRYDHVECRSSLRWWADCCYAWRWQSCELTESLLAGYATALMPLRPAAKAQVKFSFGAAMLCNT